MGAVSSPVVHGHHQLRPLAWATSRGWPGHGPVTIADESLARSLTRAGASIRFAARQTSGRARTGAEAKGVSSEQAAAKVAETLAARQDEIVRGWADLPLFTTVYGGQHDESIAEAGRLLHALVELAGSGRTDDFRAPGLAAVREVLTRITSERLRSGGDLQQVRAEIGQLRQPVTAIFDGHPHGQQRAGTVPAELVAMTELIGSLRVVAVVVLLGESDEVVARQRMELMEISTPVIRLWEGIVAVPLIGTLDSVRSQVVMESLLSGIVDEQAAVAILDITGVPMVDTLVAQHLMKTAMAVQLMGAECVISGIRPQIAQTIVHLGIDLREITTRATLSDALKYGLARTGVTLGVNG